MDEYKSYRAVWRLSCGFKIEGRVDALNPKDAVQFARNLLVDNYPKWSDIGLPIVNEVKGHEVPRVRKV